MQENPAARGFAEPKITRRPRLSTDLSRGEGRRDSHACEPTWSADAGSLVMAPVSNEQRLAIWADIESALRQDADVERRLKHERPGGFQPLQPMHVPRDQEGNGNYGPRGRHLPTANEA